MKESTLVEMRNRIDTLGQVLQGVTHELTNLRDLAIGTMELVKQLDGYEDALKKLQDKIQEESKEEEKDESI